tara:strand:- start:1118 stop:1867 length:750 start_codon:yes stop_codon:yes gene_type:complete
MRKKIVAGNWKMNKNIQECEELVLQLLNNYNSSKADVIIAPPYISLLSSVKILKNSSIEVAAQNMHYAESGAYTGEISGSMLKSIGVNNVILGHSERRTYFNETDEMLAKKVDLALSKGLRIIFCFGEGLNDRKAGLENSIVKEQIKNALFHLPATAWDQIVLAYEPVWAIGTGETASPEQAQDMHAFIRSVISSSYTKDLANKISILYGGSVKSSNAIEIFSKPDVDGGLIGGASLDADHFGMIINSI